MRDERAGTDERLGVAEIYRRTRKERDLLWNKYVARPMAAPLVYLLRPTRITPNQVTFLSLLVALAADALLLLERSHLGLLGAALLIHLAFVLDCADGQLARIRGTSSSVGGLLDFLMDEVKAVALIAALAGRLGWQAEERGQHGLALLWLGIGLAGVVAASSGISLTTFVRRPEYQALSGGAPADADGPPAPARRRSLPGPIILAIEWVGRTVIHYPSWFYLPAAFGRAEWFLIPYITAHALYLGRTGLGVLLRLAR